MRYLLSFFLFALCFAQANAQTDTVFNQTDKQGKKQGYWKVKNPNGNLKYTAFFKDDKPLGLMKRYFDDNTLKAEMLFDDKGNSYAKLYYQQGPLTAEGRYVGTTKDSVWKYYSFYTKTVSKQENYKNGQLNGQSFAYYADGKVAEEREWKNGQPNNFWKQYFKNGVLKMSTSFSNGVRTSEFQSNYPTGKPEWRGLFVNDQMDGKWTEYDPEGGVIKSIEYKNGVAVNADQLRKEETDFLKALDKQKGRIAEPDEYNFWPQKAPADQPKK